MLGEIRLTKNRHSTTHLISKTPPTFRFLSAQCVCPPCQFEFERKPLSFVLHPVLNFVFRTAEVKVLIRMGC